MKSNSNILVLVDILPLGSRKPKCCRSRKLSPGYTPYLILGTRSLACWVEYPSPVGFEN